MYWDKYFLTELKKFTAPKRSKLLSGQSYIGGRVSKLKFLDLKTADVRSLLNRPLPLFEQPVEQQFKIFQKIWISANVFELKMLPLYWLETLAIEQLLIFSKQLVAWATEIDNWALSDSLCGHYAKIFEYAPEELEPIYRRWNKHSNPWLRRISMVGILYYSRSRKKFPPFALLSRFVVPHFKAEEYYVQKAVGWTIREFYNAYPLETTRFIKNNLELIHPDAWYAATEKLDQTLKVKFVEFRRKMRRRKTKPIAKKPKNGALDRI